MMDVAMAKPPTVTLMTKTDRSWSWQQYFTTDLRPWRTITPLKVAARTTYHLHHHRLFAIIM